MKDPLFQRADEAQLAARRLVQELREQTRRAREQSVKRKLRRSDQPLLWFSSDDMLDDSVSHSAEG